MTSHHSDSNQHQDNWELLSETILFSVITIIEIKQVNILVSKLCFPISHPPDLQQPVFDMSTFIADGTCDHDNDTTSGNMIL